MIIGKPAEWMLVLKFYLKSMWCSFVCSSSLLTCNNDSDDDSDLTADEMITAQCLTRHCQPRLEAGAGCWLVSGSGGWPGGMASTRAWVTSSSGTRGLTSGTGLTLSLSPTLMTCLAATPIATPEGDIARCAEGGQWQHCQGWYKQLIMTSPSILQTINAHGLISPRRWSTLTVTMIPHSISAGMIIQPIV